MTIPAAIRALLACPKCRGALIDIELGTHLGCETCELKYPVRDGIPVMLKDQATAWTPDVS